MARVSPTTSSSTYPVVFHRSHSHQLYPLHTCSTAIVPPQKNGVASRLQLCCDFCADKMGSTFCATQNGEECWCSDEVELTHDRHGDGAECDYPCSGDETEVSQQPYNKLPMSVG